jgi:hypothetical protein
MFWLVRPASTRVMVSNSEICLSAPQCYIHSVTHWVVVWVVVFERISDLGNIVVVTTNSSKNALNSTESDSTDTTSLGILELQQCSTE